MLIKKILSAVIAILYITNSFAQETVEKKNRINEDVTEIFHVLKGNEQLKDGLYQAFYKRKTAIVSGNYTKGKKTGVWYFYNTKGNVLQVYDYTTDSLKYEAREYNNSSLRYKIDKVINDTDKITKPIKAGGRYYGYLPYLGLYKTSFSPYQYNTYGSAAEIELLISPLGRLADYKVRMVSPWLDYDQTIEMDLNLFSEEDKKFIPATFNGQPILSRIIVTCQVTPSGGLDFIRPE